MHVLFYQMSLEKGDKNSTSLACYRLFRKEFDKFVNTGAQMLDPLMTLKLH